MYRQAWTTVCMTTCSLQAALFVQKIVSSHFNSYPVHVPSAAWVDMNAK